MRVVSIGLAMSAVVAMPALAQDRSGYSAIAAGDLGTAERTLIAERRVFPNRPELMLNLAAVYQRTGRVGDARALYGAALTAPDVALDLPDGTIASSRVLAQAGLRRLTQAIATR